MGIIIQVDPRAIDTFDLPPIQITLDCDAPIAFFCRGIAVFTSPDGFVGCHAAAMRAGWLERQSSEGRIWVCPECSGK